MTRSVLRNRRPSGNHAGPWFSNAKYLDEETMTCTDVRREQ